MVGDLGNGVVAKSRWDNATTGGHHLSVSYWHDRDEWGYQYEATVPMAQLVIRRGYPLFMGQMVCTSDNGFLVINNF